MFRHQKKAVLASGTKAEQRLRKLGESNATPKVVLVLLVAEYPTLVRTDSCCHRLLAGAAARRTASRGRGAHDSFVVNSSVSSAEA